MSKYKCFRCNYETTHKGSMYSHWNKQKKCEKTTENSIKYTDDQIFKLSFIKYDKNKNITLEDNITNDDAVCVSRDNIMKELKNLHNNSVKECQYCKKSFTRIETLKNHILTECNKLKICDAGYINNSNNINSNNTVNSNNNFTVNLFTNNDLKNTISFNEKWDTSHLNEDAKLKLFVSTLKYTQTLEYILKNSINQNFLLDKNAGEGYIYSNNQIEKMTFSEVIDKAMLKIYHHLKDFSNELKSSADVLPSDKLLFDESKITEDKLTNYNTDEKLKENVQDCMFKIYDKFNDNTREKFSKMIDIKNEVIKNGY